MSNVIAPIAFIAAAIGMYFTYIGPAWVTLQEFQILEEKINDGLQRFADYEAKFGGIMEKYSNLKRSDLDRLEKILPDRIDVVRTVISIDTLASKNDINIKAFGIPNLRAVEVPMATTDGSMPSANYEKAMFTLTCSGSYQDMKSFLRGLESSLTLMDITTLDVSNNKTAQVTEAEAATAKAGDLEYKVSIQMYWLL